jgi:hypothetical protein
MRLFLRRRSGSAFHRRAGIVMAAAMSAAATGAWGQVSTWNLTTSGNYLTGTNWNPAAIPATTNSIFFNLANTYNVTFSSNIINVNATQTAGTISFVTSAPETLTLNGQLVENGGTLNVNGLKVFTTGIYSILNGSVNLNPGTTATAAGLNITPSLGSTSSNLALTGATMTAGATSIGLNGLPGMLTVQAASSLTVTGSLSLANSGVASSAGTILVSGGSTMSVAGIANIAANGIAGLSGQPPTPAARCRSCHSAQSTERRR